MNRIRQAQTSKNFPIILICGLLFLLVSFGCSNTAAREGYDRDYFKGKKAGDISITPTEFKDMAAEAGKLIVHENREATNSNLIELSFIRLPAGGDRKYPPVLYLAGTGGSAIQEGGGRFFFSFLQRLNQHADIILLDIRGLGSSYPNLRCEGQIQLPLDQVMTAESALAAYQELLGASVSYWQNQGVDLSAYNTREVAADIDVLLRTLGEETAILFGFSYGTHLAMQFIKAFPDRVHSAILAGVEGPDHTYKLPSNIDRSIRKISELVGYDQQITTQIGSFYDLMKTELERLRESPRLATGKHPRSGETMQVLLGPADLQLALKMSLKHRLRMQELPHLLWQLSQGNDQALAGAALRMRTIRPRSLTPYLIDCASGVSAARRERINGEKANYLMGDFYNFPMPQICQTLGTVDLGENFRQNPRSDKPVLIVDQDLDIHTPLANVDDLLPGFSAATVLSVKNDGHSPWVFSGERFQALLIKFIENGSLLEIESTYNLPPIKFKPPGSND